MTPSIAELNEVCEQMTLKMFALNWESIKIKCAALTPRQRIDPVINSSIVYLSSSSLVICCEAGLCHGKST